MDFADFLNVFMNLEKALTVCLDGALGLHEDKEVFHLADKDLVATEINSEYFLSIVDLDVTNSEIDFFMKLEPPELDSIIMVMEF